jgi:L-malate glycosyltransferase
VKKLLIIPAWYPSTTAPINGIFIEDQAVVLSEKYDVMVYSIQSLNRWDLLFGRTVWKNNIEQQTGIKVYRTQILGPPQYPLFAFWKYYLDKVRKAFQKILVTWGKPDLIHAHVILPTGWAAMKLGQYYDIPVVLTEHSGPFSVHLTSSLKQRLAYETLTNVNRVLAVSPALSQNIRHFYPNTKIDVVGNVIRTDLFARPIKNINLSHISKQSGIRFLSVAHLNEQKGIHYLLEAAQLLIQRGITHFELLIGGDGPFRYHLEKMAEPFSEQCHFLGMLNRQEVIYWMQQCDVFVLPSLGETFGVVLGEAMACGKPVIATRCGGPEFVVTPEIGILVKTADSEVLAEAMTGFILKQFNYDASKTQRSIDQRFGEDAFLKNISTIYEKIWA